MTALLVTNVSPIGSNHESPALQNVLLHDDAVGTAGPDLTAHGGARFIDGNGAFLSPGWTDHHAHVWHLRSMDKPAWDLATTMSTKPCQ
jgi:dihydroorotase